MFGLRPTGVVLGSSDKIRASGVMGWTGAYLVFTCAQLVPGRVDIAFEKYTFELIQAKCCLLSTVVTVRKPLRGTG